MAYSPQRLVINADRYFVLASSSNDQWQQAGSERSRRSRLWRPRTMQGIGLGECKEAHASSANSVVPYYTVTHHYHYRLEIHTWHTLLPLHLQGEPELVVAVRRSSDTPALAIP